MNENKKKAKISKIIELISNISEKIGEINSLQDSPYHVQLRKENRINLLESESYIFSFSILLFKSPAVSPITIPEIVPVISRTGR